MPSEDRPISDAFSDSLGPAPVEPKATVMVVDDEAAVRRVLVMRLQLAGYLLENSAKIKLNLTY